MDINLLNDTKGDDPDGLRKKPVPPPDVELTAPGRERLSEKKAKPPSRFSVWLKGLGGQRKPELPKPYTPERLPRPKPDTSKITPPEVVVGPTDIFADVDAKPAKPVPRPVSAPPPPKRPAPVVRPAVARTQAALTRPEAMGEGFSVNLLPEEFSASPLEFRHKLISLALAAVLSVMAIIALYFLMIFYETNFLTRGAEIEGDTAVVKQQISTLREKQREALAFKNRVDVFHSALDQHIVWSAFFDKLQQYTVEEVALRGAFQAALGVDLTLEGQAKDVEAVAHQLAVLQQTAKDFVISARLEALTRSQALTTGGEVELGGYDFSIGVTLVPTLFTLGGVAPATSSDAPGGGL